MKVKQYRKVFTQNTHTSCIIQSSLLVPFQVSVMYFFVWGSAHRLRGSFSLRVVVDLKYWLGITTAQKSKLKSRALILGGALIFPKKIESRHSTIVQWLTVYVAMQATFSMDCISLDNDLAYLNIQFVPQTVSIIKTLVDEVYKMNETICCIKS